MAAGPVCFQGGPLSAETIDLHSAWGASINGALSWKLRHLIFSESRHPYRVGECTVALCAFIQGERCGH